MFGSAPWFADYVTAFAGVAIQKARRNADVTGIVFTVRETPSPGPARPVMTRWSSSTRGAITGVRRSRGGMQKSQTGTVFTMGT